ncbi:hypothetical protein TWF481_010919 [Arthrobotrys musiformis]|uniref:Uncharacterized protein n=1 Tax=Arthrobotrys musiformis TaxID=47236 RepID=A0AAV9VYR4_9PEZI
MSRNACFRSNIPDAGTSSLTYLMDGLNIDENGQREEVRLVDPDIEDAYQNEGDGMRREAFYEYLEVKKTIRPLNIVKRTTASTIASSPLTEQTAGNPFVPSRKTTMHKWGPPGEDIPEGTPDKVRQAMLSLESLIRQSEIESTSSSLYEPEQNFSFLDPEAEARRLLHSPKTSPVLLDRISQIPFVPIGRSRVTQLRRSLDKSSTLASRQASPYDEDHMRNRMISGSRRPSNYSASRRQHAQSAAQFGPRSTSSSGLTAEEFMAIVRRGSSRHSSRENSRTTSRANATSPPSGATFRGRRYSPEPLLDSPESSVATDQDDIEHATSSKGKFQEFKPDSKVPKSLGHSISTTRRQGTRLRSPGTPSGQYITVTKGRRGPSRVENQPDTPAVSEPFQHDLSFLPKETFDPATETPAETSTRKERAMLAYFVHVGVNFMDDNAVRQARFEFQRIWEDCRLGPTGFRKPSPRGEITDWI